MDPEVVGDVGGRRRRDGEQVGDLLGDPLLHLGESVPAVHQRLAPPARSGQVQDAVAGDRVVHGGHHGHARRRDLQQAGAQALVVVHDVEFVEPRAGRAGCGRRAVRRCGVRESRPSTSWRVRAGRSGRGSRWAAAPGTGRVRGTGPGSAPRRSTHAGIQAVRVGRAGEHLDVVAQLDQSTAEVTDVDALAAAVGLAAIGQQRNSQALTHATPRL